MAATQAHREMGITTPFGTDVLLFRRMEATEELGRLSRYELELLSTQGDLAPDTILGQPVDIRLDLAGGTQRHFHGHVVRFGQAGIHGRLFVYRATVRPALWFMTLASDCRIFQKKSVLEILKEVVDAGYPAVALDQTGLTGSYLPREYTVQYRESDFDFISRLLESEGIYYFFRHEAGKHTMVLADSYGGHHPVAGTAVIPYRPFNTSEAREYDHVSEWLVSHQIQSGKCALNDFDFQKFGSSNSGALKVSSSVSRSYQPATLEVYDYPGSHTDSALGETRARVRIEALQSHYERVEARTNARQAAVGALFSLSEHPRDDQNREYLVVAATTRLYEVAYDTVGGDPAEPAYRCELEAIQSQQAYRSLPTTPKAVVRGPQTATVVGPAGEEIHTDQYGRVMAQFHWDRVGARDEHAVCWMRVAQDWAGKRWGSVYLPRIGQEVIVDFLEGDPDAPIIVGSVYNSDHMPPYTLPDRKTVSTLKSNSSKGGGGYNELRFEDKKGSEQIYLHAEKNQDNYVKHDALEWVGHDRSLMVVGNQLESVDGNKSLTVKGTHAEKIEGKQSLEVKGDQAIKVGGKRGLAVTGDLSDQVTGSVSLDVSQKLQQKVGTSHAVDAGKQIHLKAGMDIVIEAGMSITLKAGGGFIVVGPSGVTISGSPILLNSGGSAGSGDGCSPKSPDAPSAPDAPTKADDGSA